MNKEVELEVTGTYVSSGDGVLLNPGGPNLMSHPDCNVAYSSARWWGRIPAVGSVGLVTGYLGVASSAWQLNAGASNNTTFRRYLYWYPENSSAFFSCYVKIVTDWATTAAKIGGIMCGAQVVIPLSECQILDTGDVSWKRITYVESLVDNYNFGINILAGQSVTVDRFCCGYGAICPDYIDKDQEDCFLNICGPPSDLVISESYTGTGYLVPGDTYWYCVATEDYNDDSSAPCDWVYHTVGVGMDTVSLTWRPDFDAKHNTIYKKNSEGVTWYYHSSSASNTFTDDDPPDWSVVRV
jgi:hypothetical protein